MALYKIKDKDCMFLIQDQMAKVNALDFGPFDFNLVVDVAEPKFMREILRDCKFVSFKQLHPFGADYHFRINRILYKAFERKGGSGSDFRGSMSNKDTGKGGKRIDRGNRLHDQLEKMSKLPTHPSNVFFLFEADSCKDSEVSADPRWIVGELTDIVVERGHSIYVTNSPLDTIFHLLKIIKKAHDKMRMIWPRLVKEHTYGPMYYREEEKVQWESEIDKLEEKMKKLQIDPKDGTSSVPCFLDVNELRYINSHHVQRNDEVGQAATFVQMLRAIPGISKARAIAIAPYFQEMYTFLNYLKYTDKKEVIKELGKISFVPDTVNVHAADYDPSNVKTQRIGPGTVKNLYENLFIGNEGQMPAKQPRLKKDIKAEGATTKPKARAKGRTSSSSSSSKGKDKKNKIGDSTSEEESSESENSDEEEQPATKKRIRSVKKRAPIKKTQIVDASCENDDSSAINDPSQFGDVYFVRLDENGNPMDDENNNNTTMTDINAFVS